MSRINGFTGRRNFLKLAGVGSIGLGATVGSFTLNKEGTSYAATPSGSTKPQPVRPHEALSRLIQGNERFIEQKRLLPHQTRLRILETASAQYPFAAILGCADSRVPAEIVFDQGIGDLFVVRVAGNVASNEAIGSLEYATANLGTQLIMVVGHTKCGAVHAAVENQPLPGRISSFAEDIKPAVELVKNQPGDLELNSVISNVKYQVQKLEESPSILGSLIALGKLKILGGYYDIGTGKFTLLI